MGWGAAVGGEGKGAKPLPPPEEAQPQRTGGRAAGSTAPAAGAAFIYWRHIPNAYPKVRPSAAPSECNLNTSHYRNHMERTSKSTRDTSIARAALGPKLNGRSSLERGRERALTAVGWIYRWDYASSTTIEILVGTERSGLAPRLVKNGFLVNTKTESRRNEKFLPGSFFTLTPAGKHLVEVNRMELLPYEHRPDRVNQNHLMHNEMAQRITAERSVAGVITDYRTEKEMRTKSQNSVKNPDVVWILPDGNKQSVEIELSGKWERDLDVFVLSTLISLSTKDGPARFDKLLIITDSRAILKRYQEAFKPGSKFWIWQKSETGRWTKVDEKTVPTWSTERIKWELI